MIKEKGLEKKYPFIGDGNKMKYCYLRVPNPTFENIIGVPTSLPRQLGLDQYIDYNLQFEKSFLSPLRNILTLVGYQEEKQLTLW